MSDTFEGWAICELMGRRRLAGHISEQEIAGQAFLRLDVPAEPPVTQFYSPAAVYCITPTTEEIARAVAAKVSPRPVSRYELEPPTRREGEASGLGPWGEDPDWSSTEDGVYDRGPF